MKYKTEGAGQKKFIVGKFLNYKMVDSKSVMSQVQEMQLILHDLHAKCMEMSESSGIIHQTTTPYSPQYNDVAERKNRTLKKMMNDLLINSGLPDNLWGEAILSANHILNKIPHKQNDRTPYELWTCHKSAYKYLKVWGCLAKVEVPKPKQVKIGPKKFDGIFIGYVNNSCAYRFLVHKSDILSIYEGTTIESRNAVFFENVFPRKEGKNKERNEIQSDEGSNENEKSEPSCNKISIEVVDDETRRSKRARIEKILGPTSFLMC
ncbi:hypothetical protein F511_01270 [Dorcoceras hygrometricum]|uniref:Integrase catalytic domain-containing protein n=1 Tax=Dorcoceras hygrometricum TaxID=472368 RepID=A0A2Z7BS14_9LAMI|nr:hypothetical protein F511_01270 [Dorcoceras hygrometricum]